MNNSNNKLRYFVGIDPDCEESGVAVVDKETRKIEVFKMKFCEVFKFLAHLNGTYGESNHVVIIEGGWLNQSNWHVLGKFMSTKKAAAIGRSTGMNHQTGMLIKQVCEYMGIPHRVVKPLKKCWSGKDGKITQDEAKKFMGKLPRMSQDQRDALLLAWVYADLQVKITPDTSKKKTILQKTVAAFDD